MSRKIKVFLFLVLVVSGGILYAGKADKDDEKRQDYYDAEKIKVIRTHQLTTDGEYSNPRWSPAGDMFSAQQLEPIRGLAIFELKSNGKKAKKVALITEVDASDYDWSPGGEEIVYSARETDIEYSLWVVDVEKLIKNKIDAKKMLTETDVSYPHWSPDGERIVFSSAEGIGIINSNGSGEETIISGDSYFNKNGDVKTGT